MNSIKPRSRPTGLPCAQMGEPRPAWHLPLSPVGSGGGQRGGGSFGRRSGSSLGFPAGCAPARSLPRRPPEGAAHTDAGPGCPASIRTAQPWTQHCTVNSTLGFPLPLTPARPPPRGGEFYAGTLRLKGSDPDSGNGQPRWVCPGVGGRDAPTTQAKAKAKTHCPPLGSYSLGVLP